MERKESVYDMEDPGYHRIAFFPVLEASACEPVAGTSQPVQFQIKSIIRQTPGRDVVSDRPLCPHQLNRSKEEGDVVGSENCAKCGIGSSSSNNRRCVSFYPTPHLLVYERTTGHTTTRSGSMPDMMDVRDIWLAHPSTMAGMDPVSSGVGAVGGGRRMTLVRQKAVKVKRYHLLHPSNLLILIVLIGILAVFLMTKRKKKMDNPLDILMAFV